MIKDMTIIALGFTAVQLAAALFKEYTVSIALGICALAFYVAAFL